jgi:transposase-like protein
MTTNDERVVIERLQQENDRLRAENAALRPLIVQLRHDMSALLRRCDACEYCSRHLRADLEHA